MKKREKEEGGKSKEGREGLNRAVIRETELVADGTNKRCNKKRRRRRKARLQLNIIDRSLRSRSTPPPLLSLFPPLLSLSLLILLLLVSSFLLSCFLFLSCFLPFVLCFCVSSCMVSPLCFVHPVVLSFYASLFSFHSGFVSLPVSFLPLPCLLFICFPYILSLSSSSPVSSSFPYSSLFPLLLPLVYILSQSLLFSIYLSTVVSISFVTFLLFARLSSFYLACRFDDQQTDKIRIGWVPLGISELTFRRKKSLLPIFPVSKHVSS